MCLRSSIIFKLERQLKELGEYTAPSSSASLKEPERGGREVHRKVGDIVFARTWEASLPSVLTQPSLPLLTKSLHLTALPPTPLVLALPLHPNLWGLA